MPELPIATLQRWEEHGAIWRAVSVTTTEALVDLCYVHGRARRTVALQRP